MSEIQTALEPSSCRMTHGAGGDIFADTSADLVSVPCSWCLHRKLVPADSAGRPCWQSSTQWGANLREGGGRRSPPVQGQSKIHLEGASQCEVVLAMGDIGEM